jgi:hypothetical protein
MYRKKSMSKRILSLFRQDPKIEYNATTIDRILNGKIKYDKKQRKTNIHQITKELKRLTERGHITNPHRGFYSLRISAKTLHLLDNPPVVCHGIKIETTMTNPGTPQTLILGITSKETTFDVFSWLKMMNFSETTNKRWVKRFFWEGRFITLTVHPKCGLIEIWVKCSENPMDFSSMFRFNEYMKGKLDVISDFKDARVREIGINKDFRELRLEGVSSMSLRVFMNAWSRIYYKESIGAVRAEIHWVGSISFQDCVELIGKINAPVIHEKKMAKKWDDGIMFG